MDILDQNDRGEFFDLADEVIQLPDVADARIRDPEVYMMRLALMQSPRERLIEYLKSQFIFYQDTTHEVVTTRSMGLVGLSFGWLFGGIYKSRHLFEDFQRQHNASVFDSRYRGQRLYFDNFIYHTIRKGTKFGVGSGLLCYSVGFLAFGSLSYRNELYLPDWLVGFATIGAISRCNLGLRGLVFGTGIGLFGGCLGYGIAALLIAGSGKSVAEMKYMNHMEYLKKRQAQLNRNYRLRDSIDRDKLSKVT